MGQHYDWRKLGAGRSYRQARRQSVWEQVRALARAYYRRWKGGRNG
jgi:hypothetical protein